MTTLSCDMVKYLSCPSATKNYTRSTNTEFTINHSKDRLMTMLVGETTIILQLRKRNFNIYYKEYTGWDGVTIITDPTEGTSLQCTDNINTIFTANVAESYRCVDSTLYFLDTRYNNAVVKEVDQTLTFSKGPTSDYCNFKLTWGIFPYHKLKIDNGEIHTTTTLYLIMNGVKKILKTTDVITSANIPILIVPQPPSMAIPQDPEVVTQGFYDYFGDGGVDLTMAQQDGGQDFYYPEWCRRIGRTNQTLDIQEATDRYSSVFLQNIAPINQSMTMPPIATDGAFNGSMTVDSFGNLFYSMEIDGEIYNHLDGVEDDQISTLLNIEGANPKYYPIGVL